MAIHDQPDYSDPLLNDSPARTSKRRSPPRVNGRGAKKPSRQQERVGGESLAMLDGGESSSAGQFSLAHELAAALMPQPTTSKLLAEEFGLEFEDDAENGHADRADGVEDEEVEDLPTPRDVLQDQHGQPSIVDAPIDNSPPKPLDPFVALTRDVETMDKFLGHLRHLDENQGGLSEPPLERAASELIRRLNDTIRSREDQVRQLLELEREFRRMGSEVGGTDLLANLDELEKVEGLQDHSSLSQLKRGHSRLPSLAEGDEEEWVPGHGSHSHSRQGSYALDEPISPASPSFPPDPLPSPSATIPHVSRFRADTKSLARSLTSLSEQTQMNGAAVGEAGRKLRALKNKLGTWQDEYESAEQSRVRIAEWESAGLATRIRGKQLAEEQLRGFQTTLDEVGVMTDAILRTNP
jgi:hypothetical protein